MYVDRGVPGQVAALAVRLMSQPEGWGSDMRIESSVTSISWIPSEAIAGVTRLPFDLGVTHYDDPPPDEWKNLDAVVGPEGARFANNLRAWIEVEDGRIVAQGQSGGGRVSNTLFRLGGMRVLVEAVGYPELRPEPVAGEDFVRFTQTAGGRPGMPSPRLVKEAPFVKTQGPAVWTTLALTLYADGSTGYELVGASPFPRHWIYDSGGALAGKSALIDFKTWYRTATVAHSPWHGQDRAVPAAEAETPLERRLSLAIMRGGSPPAPAKVKAGTTIMAEGEAADDIVLLLDGMVEVEAGGTVLAELGPGAVLGERASLEQGRRTATVRALTGCRIVSYRAADLPPDDLRELAAGHHREDQR
jgi:Cyclic nucleotide-binding domain